MSTIKIYSNYTQTPVSVSNTGSVNLEEVKSALVAAGADANSLNDSKFVVRQNKLELSYADSLVPAGDQIIMVSPAKTKAGALNGNDFLDESGKASGTRIVRMIEALSKEIDSMKEEFNNELNTLKNFTTAIAEELEVEVEESEDDFSEEEEVDQYAHLSAEDAAIMRELNNL